MLIRRDAHSPRGEDARPRLLSEALSLVLLPVRFETIHNGDAKDVVLRGDTSAAFHLDDIPDGDAVSVCGVDLGEGFVLGGILVGGGPGHSHQGVDHRGAGNGRLGDGTEAVLVLGSVELGVG
mmetsp:Transcript_3907/g.8943  ORF Transcript_3907/g.8943 Transcript_3907/m.8943 type:complete len:123 (-) Transcript_3907:1298-1666(-)